MSSVYSFLIDMYREATAFDSRDLLVDPLRSENKIIRRNEPIYELEIDVIPKKILNEAIAAKKEFGTNTLSWTHFSIVFKDSPDQHIPLIVEPLDPVVDKVNKLLKLESTGIFSVNPYVPILLERMDLVLPENINHLLFENQESVEKFESLISELKRIGIAFCETDFLLGNFHPHRFSHLKDLDLLIHKKEHGAVLNELITGEKSEVVELEITEKDLFDSDSDQDACIKDFAVNNLAVIGPPGTGKSQFLTNLLGKTLYSGYSSVVLSEKRSALEIIQKRLRERGLDHLTIIHTNARDNKDLIAQLKNNWRKLELTAPTTEVNLLQSHNLLSNLQFILDVLNQKDTIGGVSLNHFLNIAGDNFENGVLLRKAPNINEYVSHKAEVEELYRASQNHLVKKINLTDPEKFDAIDFVRRLTELQQKFVRYNATFSIHTIQDIEHAIVRSTWGQIVQNDLYRENRKLFIPDSKQQKTFLKLHKQLKACLMDLEAKPPSSHWIRTLGNNELLVLKNKIGNQVVWGIGARYAWKKVSRAPFKAAPGLIEEEIERLKLIARYGKIKIELQQLDLTDDPSELILIDQWIKRFSKEEWQAIADYAQFSAEFTNNIHEDFNNIKREVTELLEIGPHENITDVIQLMLDQHNALVHVAQLVKKWPVSIIEAVKSSENLVKLEQNIFHSNWLEFKQRYPGLAHFKPELLKEKIERILEEEKKEHHLFSKEIIAFQRKKFNSYEELLQTPSRKLSVAEKELKSVLRKGKQLLSREFSKRSRHQSFFALYNSEASEWIKVLVPVILCNTEQVALSFPLEPNIFDVAIFDEASQVPLSNSIGAAYRSKRIIIAGDDQQMRPVKAFSGRSHEIQDLLSHSLMYFKNGMLKHHYRSYSEKLIAFSNSHFYKNELIAYPSYPLDPQPITFHKLSGNYAERVNDAEAKTIAKRITELVKTDTNFGVVAFSTEQIDHIWNQLGPSAKEALQLALDQDRAFMKPVEKVQGDECDELLISFTFGKDARGHFKYTFGPMSTLHGMNRLNVLLTRARKKIEFYATIDSTDFRITSNPSIELIRKWFQFIESMGESEVVQFPHGLLPEINGNRLQISISRNEIPNAMDLTTLYSVLQKRGWKIEFN